MTTLQQQARALGDPTRYAIFRYIAEADAPVGVAELTDHLGVDLDLRPGRSALPLQPGSEHALLVVQGRVAVDGRALGTGQLGYLGVAWAPTAVAITTGIGLISGVQVMTARHIGEGRPEATGGVFRRGVVYAFWLGVAAGALLLAVGRLLPG